MDNYSDAHASVMAFALMEHIIEEVVKSVAKDKAIDQAKAGTVVFNTIVQTALTKR